MCFGSARVICNLDSHSQVNVTGTSNSGSPDASPGLKLTETSARVEETTHAASAGGQPLHIAALNVLFALKRTRTAAVMGAAGRSRIELLTQLVHALSGLRIEKSFTLYPLTDFAAPTEARQLAALKAELGVGWGSGAGSGGGEGGASLVGADGAVLVSGPLELFGGVAILCVLESGALLRDGCGVIEPRPADGFTSGLLTFAHLADSDAVGLVGSTVAAWSFWM